MFGLCMLLPIFSIEALKYAHASAPLIGWAIGIYGLAQAVLQIPFGILSDKYGRKLLILVGLIFIALGSLIAAASTSIYGLILGRILQGCGAMGSVVIALLADQVREQRRTSAMAILGASIGLSFALAFILGPLLNQLLGLSGIFIVIFVMAIVASLLLIAIPSNKTNHNLLPKSNLKLITVLYDFMRIFNNIHLVNLNFGVFVLHSILASIFLILPNMLLLSGINAASVWRLYCVALVVAMLVAWRLIGGGARGQHNTDNLHVIAILGLLVAEGLLYTVSNWLGITMILVIFFTAFCILEASLPMLVSKYAPVENRGAALGMYSCLQFLGMFVGGVIGGWLHGNIGVFAVLSLCVALSTCWLLLSIQIKKKGVQLWQEV